MVKSSYWERTSWILYAKLMHWAMQGTLIKDQMPYNILTTIFDLMRYISLKFNCYIIIWNHVSKELKEVNHWGGGGGSVMSTFTTSQLPVSHMLSNFVTYWITLNFEPKQILDNITILGHRYHSSFGPPISRLMK